jgi:hypothetical protein
MTLKSALQDFKENTLAAVSGLLGKLVYLASLRRKQGKYEHWGMETVHGAEATERALRTVHVEVVAGVLRTPLASLANDLEASSGKNGMKTQEFIDSMRERVEELLPSGHSESPAASHLNSVLVALSSLQRHRGRATQSTS